MPKLLAAFDKLMSWGRRHGLVPQGQLIGMPLDDLDVTPMPHFRFDWCLVLPPGSYPDGEVSFSVIPANRFATVHCRGDIHKEDRACEYLFHSWLPDSSYQPGDEPTMDVYRRHPLEIGWETFDMDCCLPVRPLRRR
jgi:DNA gyrase inhibitor GyrI